MCNLVTSLWMLASSTVTQQYLFFQSCMLGCILYAYKCTNLSLDAEEKQDAYKLRRSYISTVKKRCIEDAPSAAAVIV